MFGIGLDRRPGSPSSSKVAEGFVQVPVESAGEAAGVVSEVAGEEKIGGNGVEGTFQEDMTRDETSFEGHAMSRSNTLSQMCDHIFACERAQRETVRVCAYGEVFSVQKRVAHIVSQDDIKPLMIADIVESMVTTK